MMTVRRARVELHLNTSAPAEQRRELGVFVDHCIHRIERDLGRAAWWTIKIVPDRVCYSCDVIARHDDGVVTGCGHGFDGAVASREAFRKVESLLRARRAIHPSLLAEVACGRR
jgi:hypothetical protein